MGWQSRWEQARETRLDRTGVGALVAGLILGLILGLLIGWVWWPVEWQGPAGTTAVTGTGATGINPTLGSQFETPEAKALYLGAVADAFVYAGSAGDTDAAAVAAQRLAALGGDLRAAFNNAIDFYRAQAGGAVRANNLATLALAVGIPVDANAAGTGGAGGQGGTANTAGGVTVGTGGAGGASGGTTTTTTTTTTATGGASNWPLVLLALLLIGGGLFILWMLRRQQAVEAALAQPAPVPANQPVQAADADFARDDDEETQTTTSTVYERSTLGSTRPGLTPAASMRSTVDRPQAAQGSDFDQEADDFHSGAARYAGQSGEDEDEEEEFTAQTDRRTVVGVYNWVDDDQGGQGDTDDGDEGDEGDEPISPAAQPPARTGDRPASSGFVTSVGAAPPFTGAQASPPAQPAQRGAQASSPAQPPQSAQRGAQASSPAQRPPINLQPPTPARYDQYTPVEGYTATYYLGRTDFDYSKGVPKPDNSGYDGEYGIGIADGGVLDNIDMTKVFAFSVYLFDKTDETEPLTTVSRFLLSPYGDDHRAEIEGANEGETKRQPPLVAQPSTNFQLEGRRLLLDCLVKQVDYTPEGFFRSATIELVLKRKG